MVEIRTKKGSPPLYGGDQGKKGSPPLYGGDQAKKGTLPLYDGECISPYGGDMECTCTSV